MLKVFEKENLNKLYKPKVDSSNEDNGQVTIICGSRFFHGAPLLSLKVASRIVDMVFFTSPEPSLGGIVEHVKSKLLSFIWVPWKETEKYIEKSDAVLIGPGLMRFASEQMTMKLEQGNILDEEGRRTREITKRFLEKFPDKKWVIDAGSLQVMDPEWMPEGAIITPNKKEFEILFGKELELRGQSLDYIDLQLTSKYKCTIVLKGLKTIVCSPSKCVNIPGGNTGLTKGGTGDVLAGLTVALLAKNGPFLAACAASYISKAAADELYQRVGPNYNADDLAEKIPEIFWKLVMQ